MKRQVTTFFVLIYTMTAFCQETKLVKLKFNGQISHKYYVLKSEKKVKHGEYISYYPATSEEYRSIKKGTLSDKNLVKETGYYKFGKKDSLWTEFLPPQRTSTNDRRSIIYGIAKSQGYYKGDKK